MGNNFYDRTEADLYVGSEVFMNLVSTSPGTYEVPLPLSITLANDTGAFRIAYVVSSTPATKTRGATAAKDVSMATLRQTIADVVKHINAATTVTAEMRIALGLHLAKSRQSVPAPTERPALDLVGVAGKTVTVRAHRDDAESKRGKPKNVVGAKYFYFVGEDYPAEAELWNYAGDATKGAFSVVLNPELPAGTKVFVTAAWYIRKDSATGPLAIPISTNLNYSGATSTGALKIAA